MPPWISTVPPWSGLRVPRGARVYLEGEVVSRGARVYLEGEVVLRGASKRRSSPQLRGSSAPKQALTARGAHLGAHLLASRPLEVRAASTT